MKKIKYIIMAMTGVLFASCMGSDYAEPASKQPEIKQTNVISIDSLKTIKEYSTAINGNSYKEITEYRYSPLSPATMHKAISTTRYPCRTRQAVYSYASVRVVSTAICP